MWINQLKNMAISIIYFYCAPLCTISPQPAMTIVVEILRYSTSNQKKQDLEKYLITGTILKTEQTPVFVHCFRNGLL